jgi:hypothetical protein
MNGNLNDSPGSSLIATTLPNCKTKALFLSSTINIDDSARTKTKTTTGIM